MIGSVVNEGQRGLQNAQRELQRSASDIARTNVRETPNQQVDATTNEPTSIAPLEQSRESEPRTDINESIIELRRQEQLFTASAQVVSVGNETIGSLIDVQS